VRRATPRALRAAWVVSLACLSSAPLAPPAAADITPREVGHARIEISADRVTYFSDDALVVARGGVDVVLPDGSRVDGDAFAMDLRQKRLLVAGHVRFGTGAGELRGAALADFLAFGRMYFLPLVPSADRWTFVDGDYAHPLKGRDMPGDAFAFPDVRTQRPYVTGRHAIIDASTFVQMEPAATAILMGPETPPLPAFVDNYSQNPAFGQNALPGATFDAPYPFYGSGNALEAIHLRYDQNRVDPFFVSFEHHSVGDDGAFAVMSLNPLTQADKQWTLLGYMPAGATHSIALDAQLFTDQPGFSQPSSSNGFADLQYVDALRRSSALLDVTQIYDSLVAGPAQPDHPFVAGLQWSGYQEPIARTGFTFRVASGSGWIHDAFGVAGLRRPDVSSDFVSGVVASPSVAGPFGSSVSATASLEQTWLDAPDAVTSRTYSLSDGKQLAPWLYGVAFGVEQSVSARDPALDLSYPNEAVGLTPAPASPNGLPVFGAETTTQAADDRTFGVTLSWQPNPRFQFGTTAQRSFYSPGQPFAPSSLTFTLRANALRSLYVTVARTYDFNYFGEGWSPRFTVQVSGQ